MKKLFFLFAFMGVFAFAATAQTKSCAKSKEACAKTCAASMAKAAAADASIVKQVANTGEVNYVRKEVCPVTGKTTMTAVEYCTKRGKFVNVSPTENKTAKATKVSSASATKKAACCKKGSKAACTKSASAKKAATTKTVNAKFVNDTGSN
ncbi:MAG: hypothetical protein AAFZ15_01605 [Bacteroidota bacterium]